MDMREKRQQARDLMRKALDERTPENERVNSAFKALAIINKYNMLSSPLDGILDSDNETISAAASIFDTLTNPEFVGKVKAVAKVAKGIGRRRRY